MSLQHSDSENGHASLLPDQSTWEGHQRLLHHDITRLTPEERWAESRLIEVTLAAAIFERRRGRIIHVDRAGGTLTDLDWLRERYARLRSKAAPARRVA